jgi:tetratricopeptide (TPR) repeat protein
MLRRPPLNSIFIFVVVELVLVLVSAFAHGESIEGSSERKRFSNGNNGSEQLKFQQAAEYHQQAIQLAGEGQYQQALPYFRAAVRKNKDQASYWSDLGDFFVNDQQIGLAWSYVRYLAGVTEMRLGQYSKARQRFLQALKIDPTLEYPHQNLNELKSFLSPEELNSVHASNVNDEYDGQPGQLVLAKQTHTLLPFPELDADVLFNSLPQNWGLNSLSNTKFDKETHLKAYKRHLSAPFVIRNALNRWGFNMTTLGGAGDSFVDYLRARFGKQRVDFYPHNMREENVHPVFTSMNEALDGLFDESALGVYPGIDASESGTYVQVRQVIHVVD